MEKNFNFYVEKSNITDETVYIEYTRDKEKEYNITPKAKVMDGITVNKIVFVSPTLTEKLIKIKINKKIDYLLTILKTIDENPDDTDPSEIRKSLVDAERLKLTLITTYVKYLGNTYQGLSLKKINIIVKELRTRLYMAQRKQQVKLFFDNLEKEYNNDYDKDETRGRGR